jgi:hypothetical protein
LSVSAACQRRMLRLASIARSEREVMFMMELQNEFWKEIEGLAGFSRRP